LLRRAHVGLGDDLEQRCTGAVQVDARHAVEVLVQRLARIFLEVRAGEPHEALLLAGSVVDLPRDREPAAGDDRDLELADLVSLGQVGVEVVLAREHGSRRDGAADREPEPYRALDRGAVRHRQHPGQRQVDRAGLGVRFGAEGGRRAREDLRARVQLHVRLESDDDFPLHGESALSLAGAQGRAQPPVAGSNMTGHALSYTPGVQCFSQPAWPIVIRRGSRQTISLQPLPSRSTSSTCGRLLTCRNVASSNLQLPRLPICICHDSACTWLLRTTRRAFSPKPSSSVWMQTPVRLIGWSAIGAGRDGAGADGTGAPDGSTPHAPSAASSTAGTATENGFAIIRASASASRSPAGSDARR